MRRAPTLGLALAILLIPIVIPGASADHTYAHRFVFEGRLVGANGFPLPAQEVAFYAEGDDFTEPCTGTPSRPITNEWGDFHFCFHKHDLKPSTVVGVTVGNVTERKIMDTAYRHTIVLLRDYDQNGTEPPGWNETYRITGKVWQPGPTTLEGVQVYGTAATQAPVNITLHTPNETTTLAVTTNAYGDFDATLQLGDHIDPANVTVTTESLGVTRTFSLSAVFHRTTVGIQAPQQPGIRIITDDAHTPQTQNNPGTDTPRITGALIGTLVLIGIIATVARARK